MINDVLCILGISIQPSLPPPRPVLTTLQQPLAQLLWLCTFNQASLRAASLQAVISGPAKPLTNSFSMSQSSVPLWGLQPLAGAVCIISDDLCTYNKMLTQDLAQIYAGLSLGNNCLWSWKKEMEAKSNPKSALIPTVVSTLQILFQKQR